MLVFEIIKVIALGVLEGVTEWLPVSSTGHLILLNDFINLNLSNQFMSVFTVVIQLGAILAVPVLFWKKLNPFGKKLQSDQKKKVLNLWGRVIIASLPAAVIGLVLDDFIDKHLFNYVVVSFALIIYGIAFILLEKRLIDCPTVRIDIDDISCSDALKIGLFQALSLVPGTSRSGATILGGVLVGFTRESSAEFSFMMAIPVMLGASCLKIVKFLLSGLTVSGYEIILLLIGIITAFAVSLVVIDFLMDFVKKRGFRIFGIYRIILGLVVLVWFSLK